ncbi:hypothetical protein SAY87_026228 [Trapa incisa]|uniref:Uncharacterized protein n=1 Tax=Trapa incisa TaxID=236973 RepID=A0AAN7GIY4_9MYRT|nr:hypothetical protein SAY87_026228 [Trapa incisa]
MTVTAGQRDGERLSFRGERLTEKEDDDGGNEDESASGRLTKFTTLRDYVRFVSNSLIGEKAFQGTLKKPFRPKSESSFNFRETVCGEACRKELKCDAEVSTFSIRDMEEYKNFCDRQDQRPLPEEVIECNMLNMNA